MERKILVVDDEEEVRTTLKFWLDRQGYAVRLAASAEEAFGVIKAFDPEVVVADVYLPGMSGLELLRRLRATECGVDVLIITGQETMDTAIEAVRSGAYDYLPKPLDPDQMERTLRHCFEDRKARSRLARSTAPVRSDPAQRLVGTSPQMIEIYKTVARVAGTVAPVLIRGETGTGKEVVARAIHAHSPHAREPFVAINCTAVPDQLLESELFGHLRGAFTGAVADRKGRFELAGRGTIFLDEIGDTAATFQAKLLRVLQEHEFYPVGSERPRKTEARVIAATHRPIEKMVIDGSFREDLYFRLRVVEIHVPPLRDRIDDIPRLARFFLDRANRSLDRPKVIPPDVMRKLQEHDWRGNVRELENAVARAVVLAEGATIRLEHLGIGLGGPEAVTEAEAVLSAASLDDATRRQVLRVLERTGGNKRKAARILEVSRPRLERLIQKFGIDVGQFAATA